MSDANQIQKKYLEIFAEIYENKKLNIVVCGDEHWFRGKDVASILGYINTDKAIRDHVSAEDKMPLHKLTLEKNMTSKNKMSFNQLNTIFISKKGLMCFLTCSKLPNKSNFIRWCKDKFDINYDIITRLYKEQETIGQLITAFKCLNFKTQYAVGDYKIDLYFPEYKLAIECDEFNHMNRDSEYEKSREEYIKTSLECKFIRYNPDDINFNIFNVVSRIVEFILE